MKNELSTAQHGSRRRPRRSDYPGFQGTPRARGPLRRRARLAALAVAGLAPLVLALPATAATQTLYVSPTGTGTACSSSAPCSLDSARTKVQSLVSAMNGDIVVSLAGGTYRRTDPLTLGAADSGRNGYRVRWTSTAGAVISGAKTVTGWTVVDSAKGIWRAQSPVSPSPRQLYVNGSPRPRASGPGCSRATCPTNSTGIGGAGATGVGGFARPQDVEASIKVRWRNFRCGVSSISGDTMVMEQPCWKNSGSGTNRTGPAWDSTAADSSRYSGVAFFENAYELIDSPGEWYGSSDGYLYYKVMYTGSDPNTGTFEVPATQTLLSLAGTTSAPVHDITVDGITFSYTRWLQPSTGDGYAGMQAGLTLTGATGPTPDQAGRYYTKPAAAVEIRTGRNVVVSGSRFTHLGAAGVKLEAGTQDSTVTGGTFTDLSGGAVLVGDTEPNPAAQLESRRNTVSYNTITGVAKEFTDSVGIWSGYDANLTIDHNTLSDLPYSGISVGWGWNQTVSKSPFMTGNRITNNAISNVLMVSSGHHDGGAIYTQGPQPESVISGNYINRSEFGAGERDGNGIYLDEQSSYLTVERNVITRVAGKWVSNWAGYGIQNTARDNWTDTVAPALSGSGSTMSNNQTGLATLPSAAVTVAQSAGAGQGTVEQLAPDLARGRTATQSSGGSAANAIDGDAYGTTATTSSQSQPYWQVDLGSDRTLTQVEIWSGTASLADFDVVLTTAAGAQRTVHVTGKAARPTLLPVTGSARYVRLQLPGTAALSVAEVKVH